MDSEERDLEEDLKRRKAEFKQQMAEMKEMDKYERKKARKERLLSRPGGSFKSKKKKAHWAWLAELEQKSPQAAAYYRYTQERKGAQKRWKSEQKRRAKKAAWDKMQRANKRAVAGDLKKAQWIAKMGGPHAARHKEYNPASMTPVQVGKSGAPQFMSLASMGYKSPAQLGFKTYTGQPNYKYTPRGASARGGQGGPQVVDGAGRYFDWNTMQWVTPQETKQKKGRGTRPRHQAPQAWAEGRREKNLPSDYGAYLKDRRARLEDEAKRQAEAYRSRPEFFDATTPPLDRRTHPSMMGLSVLTGGGRPTPLRPKGALYPGKQYPSPIGHQPARSFYTGAGAFAPPRVDPLDAIVGPADSTNPGGWSGPGYLGVGRVPPSLVDMWGIDHLLGPADSANPGGYVYPYRPGDGQAAFDVR